jgi:hypothetical protein
MKRAKKLVLDEENRGLKKARNLALVAERIEG